MTGLDTVDLGTSVRSETDEAQTQLAAILQGLGTLNAEQVERVRQWQFRNGGAFSDAAVSLGMVSRADIATALGHSRRRLIRPVETDTTAYPEDPVGDPCGDDPRVQIDDAHRNLGQLLIEMGKLSAEQVDAVLQRQRLGDSSFGDAAVSMGVVSRGDIMTALARQYRYPILRRGADNAAISRELVVGHDPFGPAAEAIRSIRTVIVQQALDKGIRSFVIAAPRRGTGCSFLAGNLAMALAQMAVDTLLVDADMRTPRLSQMFGLSGRVPGLSEILRYQETAPSHIIRDVVPFLSLLPAGACPPNPQELLSSVEFVTLTAGLEKQFGAVIYDVSPGIEFADSSIVASRVGAAIVVARRRKTRFDGVSMLVDRLRNMNCVLLGTVLNNF
ncbi:MAG: polysaccharide biosynthesis tyrosine autokinase [Azospirillaceae bacterium]|nr:polysaccharide biosynthesis tyrosine autokinase [Azospirillaceae bacterium]